MTGKVRIAFVVAVADNGVIGQGGHLPWRMPGDLRHFRRTTLGKPVIMGRKTYTSIGTPLDGRDNIVVTRQASFSAPGAHVAASVEDAIALGRKLAADRGVDEIAVIGGAEIFRATLHQADRIYLTAVHGAPPGDTYFHALDPAVWQETARAALPRGPHDQFAAEIIVLDRKS